MPLVCAVGRRDEVLVGTPSGKRATHPTRDRKNRAFVCGKPLNGRAANQTPRLSVPRDWYGRRGVAGESGREATLGGGVRVRLRHNLGVVADARLTLGGDGEDLLAYVPIKGGLAWSF